MTTTTLTPADPTWLRVRNDGADYAARCRICGKLADAEHTPSTRKVHADHLTRMGWSGMCPAPRPLDALRATLLAEGCTAESPARLDAEGERMAREERWS